MRYKSFYTEIKAAMNAPYLWAFLGWNDIRQRYRRSVLGPFWMVINTAIFVGMLGVLWSTLFKTDMETYMPFFCLGYVLWQLISSQITECSNGYSQFEYVIKQIRLPFPVFVLRLLVRNFAVFVHNLVIVFIVLMIYARHVVTITGILEALVGMVVFLLALTFVSATIMVICTRYKDLAMIVQNALMVIFYFTPIMWKPRLLPDNYSWVTDFNPVYVFIELVRGPILGSELNSMMWGGAIAMLVVLGAICYAAMSISRNRIAYWL